MFEQTLTDFLQHLKFEKRYSPHTQESYTNDLNSFRAYLNDTYQITEPAQINHFHIRSWLADLKNEGMKATSLNRKLSSISAYCKYLMREGLIKTNPVRKLHAQKVPSRLPSFMKEQESDYLMHEVTFEEGFKGQTDRLICELLYSTGMRRNELVQLCNNDIEWSLKQIRVLGKGNKERLLPVGVALLDTLRDYIAEKRKLGFNDCATLLCTDTGEPMYAKYVYRTVTKYLGGATTLSKKSPHVLRHTFATHLLNNGANIQAIRDLLGHSSLAATQVYTHNSIDKLKEIHRQSHPRG